MKNSLKLKGNEFTFQKWVECGNMSVVKHASYNKLQSKRIRVLRSIKPYSQLH